MLRGIAFFFFITLQLVFGRENPFVPAKEYKDMDAPTNVEVERGDFEQQALSLPSSARVLKYVVFGYQTLNGDTEEMRMEVDKNVDWHDPVVVTKESVLINPLLVAPPGSEVNPRPPQNQKNPPEKIKSPQVQNEQTKSFEIKPKESVKNSDSVTVGFDELIGFEAFSKRLLIISDDKLFRHFMIADPYKVVLDFRKETAFYTKTLEINYGAFDKIVLGSHSGYYRAAINLDGHYLYEFKEIPGGYELILK